MTATIQKLPRLSEYRRLKQNAHAIVHAGGPVIVRYLENGVQKEQTFSGSDDEGDAFKFLSKHPDAIAYFGGEPLAGFLLLSELRPVVPEVVQKPLPSLAAAPDEVATISNLDDENAPPIGKVADGDSDDEAATSRDDGNSDGESEESSPDKSGSLKEARRRAKIERDLVLKEFNDRYAVVNDGGSVLIFYDDVDHALRRRVYRRMTPGALRILYLNRHVCTRITDDGQRANKGVADYWLKHENRKQFIGGVTFDPSEASNNPNVLNLWRGFAVEPKCGSWKNLKNHILTVLCRGDVVHYNYIIGWMARLVQYPAEPGEVALVLRGNLGTGKGTVGHALLALFGPHGMHISSSKHLVGNFNVHLRDCCLLFSDEAFFAGDKAALGTLKALITEKVLTIEAKHVNAVQAANMLHIVMASNSDWVVPAALDERRFFVLDVSDEHKQDKPYFAAIKNELDNGGHAAMLYDLLSYDLSDFNVRDVPETRALQDQKKQSLDSKYGWWREVLMRGYVFRSKLGLESYFGEWHAFATTELLFESYRDFAKGERHPMSREQLGKFLHLLKYKPSRPGESVVGEHLTAGGAGLIYRRKPGFALGSLDDAREAFERATGLSIDWEVD